MIVTDLSATNAVTATEIVMAVETVTATGKLKRKHHHGPGKNWVQIAIEAKDSTGDLIGLAEVGYNLPD